MGFWSLVRTQSANSTKVYWVFCVSDSGGRAVNWHKIPVIFSLCSDGGDQLHSEKKHTVKVKKKSKVRWRGKSGMWGELLFRAVAGESLSDEVTVEQKPEWSKGGKHVAIWCRERSCPAEWTVGVRPLGMYERMLNYMQYLGLCYSWVNVSGLLSTLDL